VNGLHGKVIAFGSRDLKIVSTIGEEILIPYKLINTEVKIAQKRTPKILYKTFVFEEALSANLSAKNKLTKAVYSNPWIIVSRPVNIELEEDRVTLSFYVLSNEFFERAKQRLVMDFRESQ
jgi:phage gp29-like protein